MKSAEATLDLFSSKPAAGYAPDQPLAELGFAEQFLVWSLRVQWRVSDEGAEKSVLLQRAFDALEMPDGAAMIAELAGALSQTVQRPLSIPCPRWRVLTSDEVRVLTFVSALQKQGSSPAPRSTRPGRQRPAGRRRSGCPRNGSRSPLRRWGWCSAPPHTARPPFQRRCRGCCTRAGCRFRETASSLRRRPQGRRGNPGAACSVFAAPGLLRRLRLPRNDESVDDGGALSSPPTVVGPPRASPCAR